MNSPLLSLEIAPINHNLWLSTEQGFLEENELCVLPKVKSPSIHNIQHEQYDTLTNRGKQYVHFLIDLHLAATTKRRFKLSNSESVINQKFDFGSLNLRGCNIAWTTLSLVQRMAVQKWCFPTLSGSPLLFGSVPLSAACYMFSPRTQKSLVWVFSHTKWKHG